MGSLLKQMMGTVSWDDIEGKPEFATVATSGDYNDLENAPTVEEIAQEVGSNIDYNDLKNTSDIPEPYELPVASNTTLGGVKVDGETVTIGPDDTITAHAGGTITDTSFDGRGTTEQRPSDLTASNAGYRYYDSTLEQAIVWDGQDWCNEDMILLSKVVII